MSLGSPPSGGGPGGIYPETPELLESAVPEPETWAIMIIGFFGIGLALRTRARRERHLAA